MLLTAVVLSVLLLVAFVAYMEFDNAQHEFTCKLVVFLLAVTCLALLEFISPLLVLWEAVGILSFRLISH